MRISNRRFGHFLGGLVLIICAFQQDGSAQKSNLLQFPTSFAELTQLESDTAISTGRGLSDSQATSADEPLPERWLEKVTTLERWSFSVGLAVISDTRVHDYFSLNYKNFDGPGSGLTYNFTAAYRLREFDWDLWKFRVRPQLELPFMLTLVDEDSYEMFPDYNLGLKFRWRDFPWNRYVATTFAIGGGVSYSARIWTADQLRHEGEHRSHLKYWLPLEFTMALPRHPQHQLLLFIDHQSGGWMFDTGGVDAWGAGYRVQF